MKFNGEPLISIFSVDKLLESFGGSVEETRKALDYFRDQVKKAGLPGLHIQWNQGGGSLMSEEQASQFRDKVKVMGFNSVAMYNMGGVRRIISFTEPIQSKYASKWTHCWMFRFSPVFQ